MDVSAVGTVVIAVRYIVRYATVRVVPHSVVVGQQRCLTVKLRHTKKGIGIGVLPVGHHNLNSDDLGITGESGSYLSNGCIWYTTFGGRGYFTYGGKVHAAPVGLDSGDEVSAVVDRRTNVGMEVKEWCGSFAMGRHWTQSPCAHWVCRGGRLFGQLLLYIRLII